MDDVTRQLEEERGEDLNDERADFEESMRRIAPFSDDDKKLGNAEDAAEWTDAEMLSK